MNGQKAGPLLNDDPSVVCGNSCEPQGLTYPDIYNHHEPNAKKREEDIMPSIEDLELVRNKGPLLTTALALFGPQSWLDLVNRYPDLYQHRDVTGTNYLEICIDLAPLGRIFDLNNLGNVNNAGILFERNYINQCVYPESPGGIKGWNTARSAGSWLYNFRAGTAAGQAGNAFLANAFTIAAYLANMAWILEGESVANSLTVTYDLGADSQKPSISLAGMIVVSVLIGLDLLGLLATAVYASWFPRWTGSLDAFSLLRLGGSISERVPLTVSVEDDEVRVLDELPGWVGNDVRDENDAQGEKVGSIVLGGSARFQTKMVYEAYDGKALRRRNQRR